MLVHAHHNAIHALESCFPGRRVIEVEAATLTADLGRHPRRLVRTASGDDHLEAGFFGKRAADQAADRAVAAGHQNDDGYRVWMLLRPSRLHRLVTMACLHRRLLQSPQGWPPYQITNTVCRNFPGGSAVICPIPEEGGGFVRKQRDRRRAKLQDRSQPPRLTYGALLRSAGANRKAGQLRPRACGWDRHRRSGRCLPV